MRVLVVRIVTVTEMKPIGGKMRQRVTTLMFVDDWNIHRPQDRAQKAGSTVTPSCPVPETIGWIGLIGSALDSAQNRRLTAILPDVIKGLGLMWTKEMVQVVMTPREHSHDCLKAVRAN